MPPVWSKTGNQLCTPGLTTNPPIIPSTVTGALHWGILLDSHLGHGVGGRSFVQKQERYLLVIIVCCNMERGEAIL